MDSNNPMAQLAIERQQIFDQYQVELAAYEEQKRAAMAAFKKQQKSTIVQGIITAGIAVAGQALANAGKGGGFGESGVVSEANPTGASFGAKGSSMPKLAPTVSSTDGIKMYMPSSGGYIKAFARGGMNRDNVPALLIPIVTGKQLEQA